MNNKESFNKSSIEDIDFVRLWRKLEHTRRMFIMQHKRFCIRRVLQSWYPGWATDDRIATVCDKCELLGYDELPLPCRDPLPHREFLRALISERQGVGIRSVNVRALDNAYSVVFPRSRPIDVAKKGRAMDNEQLTMNN